MMQASPVRIMSGHVVTASFKYAEERKPYVPRKTDKPIMGLKTNKNFITANAVEAILQG
jgi:hypothetical protein